MPKIRDRFAKTPAPQPRLSLESLAGLPEEEALASLQATIDRHGEAAVDQVIREQATKRLRQRGWL